MSVCALLLFATSAHAQQFDFAVGYSTLFSTKNPTASQGFLPPPEKGGIVPSVSFDRIFKDHFGYSAELAFRYKQGIYNNYQQFRPLFYDVNGLYTTRATVFGARMVKRTSADFMAGVGGETVIFYNPYGNCGYASGCPTHLNSNHLLFHLGFDIRYRFWKRFFVRPEANYYYIVHNSTDFHSDNVLRLGASVGYTFPRD